MILKIIQKNLNINFLIINLVYQKQLNNYILRKTDIEINNELEYSWIDFEEWTKNYLRMIKIN